MNKVLMVAVAIATASTLTACESQDRQSADDLNMKVSVIDVDGTDVTCVKLNNSYGVGLSCDWVGFHG